MLGMTCFFLVIIDWKKCLVGQLPVGVKVALQSLPRLEVVVLDLAALLDGPVGRLELHHALEHEGLGALGNVHGLELLGRGLVKSRGIGAVGGHHRVKRSTTGDETTLLGLVGSVDQTHEL